MPVPLRPVKAVRSANVQNLSGPARVMYQPFDSTGVPIRWFEFTKISGGLLTRADNTSTTLYGMATEPTKRDEIAQIPTMPFNTDAKGRKRIGNYVFGGGNEFTGPTTPGRATTQADVSGSGTACDIAPALTSPTPVLTTGGTAGSASYSYQITARNLVGESKSISATTIATGNATLSTTNYNVITIPATTDAVAFRIYKGGSFLAEVTANPGTTTVYNDTGAVSVDASQTPPAQNDSGWVIAPALSAVGVIRILRLLDPEGTPGGRVIFTTASGKSQFTS